MSNDSRICIKNLPKFLTQQQLRKHFATRGGLITDVKLLRTSSGTSRQMAFIGYSNHEEAQDAIDHFHGTYLHTSKLGVEWALRVGDASLGKSWSRHTRDAQEDAGAQLTEQEEEERFQAFLRSVNPDKADRVGADQNDLEWLKTKKRKRAEDAEGISSADSAAIMKYGRLFVRNISYQCTEDQLRQLFSRHGELDECRIAMTSGEHGTQSKGYAFVGFVDSADALKAYAEVDGSIFQGRLVHVLAANSAGDRNHQRAATGNFKEDQLARQQENAGQSFNWNSLFVRSDTAAAAMAGRLGVSKGQFLDHTAEGSAAVRLALSEAEIVAENKRFLEESGVILDAFSSPGTRSTSVILCKNLPYSSYPEELELMFTEYGKVNKVLLTPSKTVALVDFQMSSDASKAFRNLAYRKYHDSPLFLEWAPEGVFAVTNEEPRTSPDSGKRKLATDAVEHREDAAEEEQHEEQEEEDYEESLVKALFVKNLNFRTTDEQMAALFGTAGTVVSAKVIRKKETGRSLGYGFVEYQSHEEAVNGIKALQGRVLDGHKLELSFSKPRESTAAGKSKRKKTKRFGKLSAKLVVRNIPFEASKKELKTLFSSYGQLKSLRLPKKFDKSHRGFCFVEYNSKQEAKAAMDAAGSTHLYGRHLVIEYSHEKPL